VDLVEGLDGVGRLVVAGALAWAAVAKLADLAPLRATLYLSRWTRPWVPQLSVAVPGTELVLAVALAGRDTGRVAAAAALALLVVFGVYLAFDPSARQGCHCFGGPTPTGRGAGLVRNALLAAALVPALVRGPGASRWGVPAGAEPWAGGLALTAIAVALTWGVRRAGRRGRRGRTGGREPGRRRAGVAPGLPSAVRREAEPFDVPALDGTRLASDVLARRPEGLLLVFVEPGCGLCEALLPDLAGCADAVVLAAVERAEEAVTWANAHGLPADRTAADVGGRIADTYRVPANPAACRVDATGALVDADGAPVARLAVGPDAIRALLRPAARGSAAAVGGSSPRLSPSAVPPPGPPGR